MKIDITGSDDLKIKQDPWDESPCSHCSTIHCCENLPLAPLWLRNQSDFINLILTSSYNSVIPVLKKTGEWTFYLKRDCNYLSKREGQCTIHKAPHQSMICKSYNAHTCWYVEAFNRERFTTMIPFNTEMIIWYEKTYKLIEKKFDVEINWKGLCIAAYDYRLTAVDLKPGIFTPYESLTLPFKKGRTDQFLFLPPYNRPENRNHYELLSFRLGFPGVYLAITDSCWAFLIKTDIDKSLLKIIRQEYYPGIEHRDGIYSSDQVLKKFNPYSGIGEQWIILKRSDLQTLLDLTTFDAAGRVEKIPSSLELLNALKSKNPNKAA